MRGKTLTRMLTLVTAMLLAFTFVKTSAWANNPDPQYYYQNMSDKGMASIYNSYMTSDGKMYHFNLYYRLNDNTQTCYYLTGEDSYDEVGNLTEGKTSSQLEALEIDGLTECTLVNGACEKCEAVNRKAHVSYVKYLKPGDVKDTILYANQEYAPNDAPATIYGLLIQALENGNRNQTQYVQLQDMKVDYKVADAIADISAAEWNELDDYDTELVEGKYYAFYVYKTKVETVYCPTEEAANQTKTGMVADWTNCTVDMCYSNEVLTNSIVYNMFKNQAGAKALGLFDASKAALSNNSSTITTDRVYAILCDECQTTASGAASPMWKNTILTTTVEFMNYHAEIYECGFNSDDFCALTGTKATRTVSATKNSIDGFASESASGLVNNGFVLCDTNGTDDPCTVCGAKAHCPIINGPQNYFNLATEENPVAGHGDYKGDVAITITNQNLNQVNPGTLKYFVYKYTKDELKNNKKLVTSDVVNEMKNAIHPNNWLKFDEEWDGNYILSSKDENNRIGVDVKYSVFAYVDGEGSDLTTSTLAQKDFVIHKYDFSAPTIKIDWAGTFVDGSSTFENRELAYYVSDNENAPDYKGNRIPQRYYSNIGMGGSGWEVDEPHSYVSIDYCYFTASEILTEEYDEDGEKNPDYDPLLVAMLEDPSEETVEAYTAKHHLWYFCKDEISSEITDWWGEHGYGYWGEVDSLMFIIRAVNSDGIVSYAVSDIMSVDNEAPRFTGRIYDQKAYTKLETKLTSLWNKYYPRLKKYDDDSAEYLEIFEEYEKEYVTLYKQIVKFYFDGELNEFANRANSGTWVDDYDVWEYEYFGWDYEKTLDEMKTEADGYSKFAYLTCEEGVEDSTMLQVYDTNVVAVYGKGGVWGNTWKKVSYNAVEARAASVDMNLYRKTRWGYSHADIELPVSENMYTLLAIDKMGYYTYINVYSLYATHDLEGLSVRAGKYDAVDTATPYDTDLINTSTEEEANGLFNVKEGAAPLDKVGTARDWYYDNDLTRTDSVWYTIWGYHEGRYAYDTCYAKVSDAGEPTGYEFTERTATNNTHIYVNGFTRADALFYLTTKRNGKYAPSYAIADTYLDKGDGDITLEFYEKENTAQKTQSKFSYDKHVVQPKLTVNNAHKTTAGHETACKGDYGTVHELEGEGATPWGKNDCVKYEWKINATDDKNYVEVKKADWDNWAASLKPGSYTVRVTVPATSKYEEVQDECTFTIATPNIISVNLENSKFESVSVKNGTTFAMLSELDSIPRKVTVKTELEDALEAKVKWDFDPEDYIYNDKSTDASVITLRGQIIPDDSFSNDNKVSLKVYVDINVRAASVSEELDLLGPNPKFTGDAKITLNKDVVKEVYVDGELVELDENGEFVIEPDNKQHKITIVGKDGSSKEYTVTVNKESMPTFMLNKLDGVDAIDSKSVDAAEGGISGLTTDMEISFDGGKTYQPVTDINMKVTPGTYLIRLKENEMYNASEPIKVEVGYAYKISDEKEEINTNKLNKSIKITQSKKKLSISWARVDDAAGYEVYVTIGNKNFATKPTQVVNTNKVTFDKLNGKKIDTSKNYRAFVRAYKLVDGETVYLGKSYRVYCAGSTSKSYSNPKKIKLNKTKVTVAKNRSFKINAKTVLADAKKKPYGSQYLPEFRYATDNAEIANVTKDGVIVGVSSGKTYVYVTGRNGLAAKIKVTVK